MFETFFAIWAFFDFKYKFLRWFWAIGNGLRIGLSALTLGVYDV